VTVGSGEWTRALVAAHGGTVRAYVARRVDAADVDDVVTEVFVVAWRRAEDVPVDDGARAYLLAIARRVLANQHRGTQRRLRLVRKVEEHAPRRVVVPADDEHAEVHAALERLRPDDREILRLAAWEDLSTSEIGVVLGCSAANAAVRLSRARSRFREVLQEVDPSWTSKAVRRA
jgi:RNA polymerase sigma-70 factor (ECF subfamily)